MGFTHGEDGFNPKGTSDLEGNRSPTSAQDMKTFSGVGITHLHENSLDSQLSSPKQQSETIPIGSPRRFAKSTHQKGMEHSESYTCVISHGSKWSTKTMYTDRGIECEMVQYPLRKQNELRDIASPARSNSNVAVFPVAHFLRACYLCERPLNHGKDIYMYRGDKAFCSVECRYQQILKDERLKTFAASPPSSSIAAS
eukprot:PITA_35338